MHVVRETEGEQYNNYCFVYIQVHQNVLLEINLQQINERILFHMKFMLIRKLIVSYANMSRLVINQYMTKYSGEFRSLDTQSS